MKKSQIILGNYTYPLFPFSRFLDSAVSFGVSRIELWAASPHLSIEDASASSVADLRSRIADHGLSVSCFTPEQCAYPIDIAGEDEALRKRSIRYLEKALDIAKDLACPRLVVVPGNGYRTSDVHETTRRTVVALRHLCDIAEDLGITLLLEHLTDTTTTVAVTAEQLFDLRDAVGRENLLCMYDSDMAWRYGETARTYCEQAAGHHSRLSHVHFVDGRPGGHLALGDGNVPLLRCLEELDAYRYDGTLTFEVTDERYLGDPDAAMRKCFDWVDHYFE